MCFTRCSSDNSYKVKGKNLPDENLLKGRKKIPKGGTRKWETVKSKKQKQSNTLVKEI